MKSSGFNLLGISLLFIPFYLSAVDLGEIRVEEKEFKGESLTYVDEYVMVNEQTLSQKLSKSTSINQYGGSVHTDLISIRGNNFRSTEYFEDGIPLYRTSGGYVDLSMYNANNSDIYINSGGSQGLYAPSATGGEILINSKKIKSGFNGYILSSFSTNNVYTNILSSYKEDSWYLVFDLNALKQDRYKLSDDFKYTSIQPDKERVNSDKEQFNGSLKVGYNIDSSSNIAFKFSHLKSEFGNPIQVYDEPSNPFGGTADYTRVDNKELYSYWFYYDYKDDDLKVDVRAYYDEYSDLWNWYDSPEFSALFFDESVFNDTRLGIITSLKYNYTKNQDASLSLQVDRNTHNQTIQNDPIEKNYEDIESSLSYMHNFKIDENMLISGSVKYKQQNFTKAHQFDLENIEYKDNEAVDAQITFNNKADEKLSYYLSLARKNRFASLSEAYKFFPWDSASTKVKPEQSHSIEFGTTLKQIPDTIADISVYHNKIKDMIVYQNSRHVNLEEVSIKGLEFTLYNYSLETHEVELSYSYTDAKDKTGKQVLHLPKSKILLRESAELSEDLNFVLSYLYTSSREDVYNGVRYNLDSYSLVDMQLSYSVDKDLLFKAGVKNILDKNWEYRYGMPAEGRSAFVSLKYTF